MKHAKMEFIVSEWDNKPYLIDLEAREIAHPEYFAEPPFLAEYSFTDEAGRERHGETRDFFFAEERTCGEERASVFRSSDGGAEILHSRRFEDGVCIWSTKIVNAGAKKLCVKKLFNRIGGVCTAAIKGDYRADAEIGVVRGEWASEGQFFWESPQSLGLYRATGHETGNIVRFGSPTSQTTRKCAPLLFVREKAKGTVWAFQHLPDGPYSMELGLSDAENIPGSCFNLSFGAGDNELQGFRLYLSRGESYSCCETLLTCAPDLETAVGRLTRFRRKRMRSRPAPPVMFNDYMNCLWCKLGEEECLSLLASAESVGAEGYCFDDGWYRERDAHGSTGLGDWIPAERLFGGRSFACMIEEINSRGMVAGLWTELEACSDLSRAASFPKEWFLTNEGERIFRSGRYYFNFGVKEVREYLLGRVRALYDLGIRYIKNDYNGHPGCGCDWKNASPYAGLEQHCRCVGEFYRTLGETFPDLILENCSSGAMRADAQTMRNFNSQSISDCEEYEKLPSIVNGTLLSLLPEQLSIWVYPYPRIFWEMNGESYLTADYIAERANGAETAFNLVTGFFGVPLLSGKIDRADETNLSLIRRGVALYKEWRSFVQEGIPVFPLGFAKLLGEDCPAAQGLRRGNTLLLGVWRRKGEAEIFVPCKGVRAAEELYPNLGASVKRTEGGISVLLPDENSAVLCRVELD